jgi:hypothetical protein
MDQLRLPGDPHGIEEAHDVLAADEFAMPAHADAPYHDPSEKRSGGAVNPLVVLVAAALAVILVAALRRR